MHARQLGDLNLGSKPYVRKKSQSVFVGAGYRVLLAATDSNQRPVDGSSRSLAAAASHTRWLGSERGICRSFRCDVLRDQVWSGAARRPGKAAGIGGDWIGE